MSARPYLDLRSDRQKWKDEEAQHLQACAYIHEVAHGHGVTFEDCEEPFCDNWTKAAKANPFAKVDGSVSHE